MDGDIKQDAPISIATLNKSSDKRRFSINPRQSVSYDDDALDSLVPGPLYIPRNTKNPPFDALWIESAETDMSISYTLWVFKVVKTIVHKESARGYRLIKKAVSGLKRSAMSNGKGVEVCVSYVYACAPIDEAAEWKMPKGWTKSDQGLVFCWQIFIPSGLPLPLY